MFALGSGRGAGPYLAGGGAAHTPQVCGYRDPDAAGEPP